MLSLLGVYYTGGNERLNKPHPIFYHQFLSEIDYFVWKRADASLAWGEILIFSLSFFKLLLLLFCKDEKDCKTDSVREKKKLFKDLQEGATSAGLYLHNIL